MLPGAGFAEESVETVITTPEYLVWRHLPIGLDTVFQAVQLPAGISDLYSRLPHVDGYAFTLQKKILQAAVW